jgi:molybdopterin-guanine dinucleotide biosynthesis protein A
MIEVRGGVGCVPVSGGVRQSLAAIYPVAALRELEEVVCSGERQVGIWVERCLVRGLVREVEIPAEWDAVFFNMNTPSEYAAIAASGADGS